MKAIPIQLDLSVQQLVDHIRTLMCEPGIVDNLALTEVSLYVGILAGRAKRLEEQVRRLEGGITP